MTTLAPEKMLQAGRKALGFQRYDEAIAQLEDYVASASAQNSDYYQAKMWLVKAYQGAEQMDRALALCHELRETGSDIAKIWADRYITNLAPEPEETPGIAQPDLPEPPATVLPQKNVVDFKAFCQEHLVKDLKEIEAMRQTVQKTIAVSTLIAILIVFGVVKGATSFYGATSVSKNVVHVPSQACRVSDDPQSSFCVADRKRAEELQSPVYRRRQQQQFQGERNKVLVISLLLLVGSLFCWVAFVTSSIETYSRQFKIRITEKVLKFVDPSEQLRYFRKNDGSEAIAHFSHSMMAPKANRALLCLEKDCISGTIGSTNMVVSQINVGVEKTSGLGMFDLTRYIDVFFLRFSPTGPLMVIFIVGLLIKLIRGILMVLGAVLRGKTVDFEFFESQILNQGPNIESIFKGIFFRAHFNKSVASRVTIVPNSLRSKLPVSRDWGKPVKLEDPMFGKLFTVYSQDQVAARYALSTALIDRLVTFQRKANRPVYLSIVDDRIYVGLKGDREYLEPSLLRPMTHFNPIRDYFETLQLLLGIVDDLNLNQRIWMR
jgi:Protein of unknown function (DUF3137)